MSGTDLAKWIDSDPATEDITVNSDGSKSQGIEVIERKLNFLTDSSWSTKNFQQALTHIGENIIMAGCIELVIFYNGIERVLVGAYAIDPKAYSDKNISGTLKSLCIINAASEIGRQFGSHLNETVPQQDKNKKPNKTPRKMIADSDIYRQLAQAINKGDTETKESLINAYNIDQDKLKKFI